MNNSPTNKNVKAHLQSLINSTKQKGVFNNKKGSNLAKKILNDQNQTSTRRLLRQLNTSKVNKLNTSIFSRPYTQTAKNRQTLRRAIKRQQQGRARQHWNKLRGSFKTAKNKEVNNRVEQLKAITQHVTQNNLNRLQKVRDNKHRVNDFRRWQVARKQQGTNYYQPEITFANKQNLKLPGKFEVPTGPSRFKRIPAHERFKSFLSGKGITNKKRKNKKKSCGCKKY